MVNVLKLARRDAVSHALLRGAAPVGWIRVGAIGFEGFADRVQARAASDIAASLLAEWYRVRTRTAPAAWPGVVPPDDRIEIAGLVVGRVVPPIAAQEGGADSYAVELSVPAGTWLALLLQLAQRVYLAMTDAGLTRDAQPAEAAS